MTINERAAQVAPLLIFAAKYKHILTYDEVWRCTGMNRAGLGKVLEVIKNVCDTHNLPPITMLVVRKYDGQATYFKNDVDYHEKQMKVWNYDWYNIPFDFINKVLGI